MVTKWSRPAVAVRPAFISDAVQFLEMIKGDVHMRPLLAERLRLSRPERDRGDATR